jgi:leucyl aminopeptidase (aminopeptidase T)
MVGILNILSQRYLLKRGQVVLVIFDEKKKFIAEKFVEACRKIGAKADTIKLGKKRFEDPGIMEKIRNTIKNGSFDVFFNILESRDEETKYRMELTRIQKDAGGMVGHAPGITGQMLRIPVDYRRLARKAERVAMLLKGADTITITSKLGTNLRLFVKGRKFWNDVLCDSKISNIPCGEVWCAPQENKGDGILISDGSVGSWGILPQPLYMEIRAGKLERMDWLYNKTSGSRLLDKIRSSLFQDADASRVGELGIGLAPFKMVGNMLQDEKVAGTIHVAFGANDFFGGKNKSKSHIDFLVCSPTVRINYSDSRNSLILMTNGKLLI